MSCSSIRLFKSVLSALSKGEKCICTSSFHRHFHNTNALKKKDQSTAEGPSNHHSKFMNPIVRELWEQRKATKNRIMSLSDQDSETTGSGNLQELTAKMMNEGKGPKGHFEKVSFRHPSDSKTTIDYKFKSDEFLREAYKSPGGAMRFGKVLEDLDALAGNIAFNHVVGDDVMLVTAAVDRIALKDIPVLERDQRLSGQVTYVGSSSMEIRMQIRELSGENDDQNDYCEHWLEAYFTFVAVDPKTNKPVKICPLVPANSEERALFELGALKAAKKKDARKKRIGVGQPLTEEAVQMEQRAEQLVSDAFPLIRMPSLADPQAILMSHTQLMNTLIAQPQVRNLSNKIFGGFLMRRAFELAFSNAYVFGGEWPQMLEVDNITFNAPVNVGDLLQFNSRVIYSLPDGGHLDDVKKHSSKPLVMIEVECYVMEPEIAKAHLSNQFYFTFVMPTKETCRKVLPGTLEEARRMVQRMVADEEQAGLGKGYLRQYDLLRAEK
jgi:acyl-coenzyme A thioesterase 9